jgi:hypothetical protein
MYLTDITDHDTNQRTTHNTVEQLSNEEDRVRGSNEHDSDTSVVDSEGAKHDRFAAEVIS